MSAPPVFTPDASEAEIPQVVLELVDNVVSSFVASGKRAIEIRSYLGGQWQVFVQEHADCQRFRSDFL